MDSVSPVYAEISKGATVRRATPQDLNNIIILIQESKKEVSPGLDWNSPEIEKTLAGLSSGTMSIAENNATPVGFAAGKKNGKVWMEEGDFYFALNYVMPKYRGKGVAGMLSYNIIEYGRCLGSSRIILEPVTVAGKKHARKIGFNLIRTEDYFDEKPSRIIKGKAGIDTYVYYVDELSLTVPDHIAVMDL